MKLTEVSSETEAAIVCGYLESNGIEATYDSANVVQAPGATMPFVGGRREVVVHAEDLDRARELLREVQARNG